MSWSLYLDCARDNFADPIAARGQDAAVFEATVPPRGVLAQFGDEREQEVVVNPNMLRSRVVVREELPARETP